MDHRPALFRGESVFVEDGDVGEHKLTIIAVAGEFGDMDSTLGGDDWSMAFL